MRTLLADEMLPMMPPGAAPTLLDESYACPSKDWVQGPFSLSLRTALDGYGFSRDRFDCDDFARLAWTIANLCNHDCPSDCGLAFGLLFYTRDYGAAHAINFFIAEGVHFYEPQTQRIVELSRKEIESCSEFIC